MGTSNFEYEQKRFGSIDDILKQHDQIKKDVARQKNDQRIFDEIDKWEKISIAHIELAAKRVRADIKQFTEDINKQLDISLHRISKEIIPHGQTKPYTEDDIKQCGKLLKDCQYQLNKLAEIKIIREDLSTFYLIRVENTYISSRKSNYFSPQIPDHSKIRSSGVNNGRDVSLPYGDIFATKLRTSNHTTVPSNHQFHSHPSVLLGFGALDHRDVQKLFEHLIVLPPMDKNTAMSGDCDLETTQMETFLSKTFEFENIRGQYIVQGVKSFQLGKPPQLINRDAVIYFPNKAATSFAMTVEEILQWQHSYRVYADKNITGMDKPFLQKALRGQSEYGQEAFRMKFIVRVSQCPVLTEFDARIISRKLEEKWPHRIKLVSVTGIDFAGRIHDVDDIRTYVSNWQDVYENDSKKGLPVVYKKRDFRRKANAPRAELNEERLMKDLMRMARLRLRACDHQKVEIVVETSIGLGVFAGKSIGIDETVRAFSAQAIRSVLEEDGPSYKNIRGIVFALPVFDQDISNDRRQDTYQAFVDEFRGQNYQGPIPVLIADQDMHRLTVAIARAGFNVSELNPADSHGVFGEYWQNRGPAMEEKLALTTVGLLVQHHLINSCVLDSKHYYLL